MSIGNLHKMDKEEKIKAQKEDGSYVEPETKEKETVKETKWEKKTKQ